MPGIKFEADTIQTEDRIRLKYFNSVKNIYDHCNDDNIKIKKTHYSIKTMSTPSVVPVSLFVRDFFFSYSNSAD